jgi:arylsulfatase A-like enzyme
MGILLSMVAFPCYSEVPAELPNILWLTSEDNSPFFGCYGDPFATTPNLDKLASEGFLYTHAYANAPVCAPARNTILTGIYASSGGNQHMRSNYAASPVIRFYPEFLKAKGYYCTNNVKTDYNTKTADPAKLWDDHSQMAHYKNRKPGQPFFAVFNATISHESSLHKSIPTEKLRHDPKKVPIPPYHPRTKEMEHDWAQYYDKIENLDNWVGEKLRELEAAGLAENTIVFYYGDHGGVLARSKRFVYESGTRVPFIVRIPEKYKYLYPARKPGDKVGRMISFVDLSPTLLSIVGEKIPDFLQGKAFLGKQKTADPEYVFMFRGRMDERYDMCRAVRDKRYRYIRNYMPYRIYGQHLEYLWLAPSVGSWEKAYADGKCNAAQSAFWNTKPAEELYDTENDPWEINNLAADPRYKEILERMRQANRNEMLRIRDTGFIPEADRSDRTGDMPIYDYMRSGNVPLEKIIDAAELASLGTKENLLQFVEFLKDGDSAIRYWGATGLFMLKDDARAAIPDLKKAISDPSANVATVAAEALYHLGEKEIAIETLLSVLKNQNQFARLHALNVIGCINEDSKPVLEGVGEMIKIRGKDKTNDYDLRAAKGLMKKWGMVPEKN